MSEGNGEPRASRYRFGPRSTRGLIAGWSGSQIAWVAASTLVGLAALRSIGGIAGAILAVVCAGTGICIAAVSVAGRPVESWIATSLRFALAKAADDATPEVPAAPWLVRPPRRRGPLSRLVLQTIDAGADRRIDVVADREAGTFTAMLKVGGEGFALLDDSGRSAAVAGWSSVLAALASEARSLHRLQWVARTMPAVLGDEGLPVARRPVPGAGPAASAYEALLTEVVPALWTRETLLAITVRSTEGSRGRHDPGRTLAGLADGLCTRLNSIGIAPGGILCHEALAGVLCRAYFPASGPRLSTGLPVSRPARPLPVGVDEGWARLRTDATWHASYWVAEWPRGEVGPGVLLPLVVGTWARCSFSVTMAPLPPSTAVRRAERERTSGAADAELRAKHGFSLTARARLEQELRHQREDELAGGHAAFRFAGYVTVTADDQDALERACRDVEQSAAVAQLDIRRLYGFQEHGWCCTLPLGRGCR